MATTTRRELLRLGLGSTSLLAGGLSVPAFLARTANSLASSPHAKREGRILVVVELDGGNDGLNTVVPFADDEYHKHRPKLRQEPKTLHKIDDRVGFHSALRGFSKLLESGRLGIVQSVGYPNPNRSHFESMAIWQSGKLDPDVAAPGWLAHWLDARPADANRGDAPAFYVGDALLPQALTGGTLPVPSLDRLEQFHRRLGMPEGSAAEAQRAALDKIGSLSSGTPGGLLQFVEKSTLISYTSSARLQEVCRTQEAAKGYPDDNTLAQQLRLVAQLIKADLATPLYYTRLSGFDTHANQTYRHLDLLRELGGALSAFLDDLDHAGDGDRVVVLVFSEFGRRLGENASGGTDHGTAAPVFLLGKPVRSGLHGPYPNLSQLEGGDPRHAIDFRRVYATLLDQWLGGSSQLVLGEKFELMNLLST